ncbi:MAG: SGNH/GDSL hydrolase family protein [Planctomycetota bacterium]|jgi:lysophospholipase L1-like esterase
MSAAPKVAHGSGPTRPPKLAVLLVSLCVSALLAAEAVRLLRDDRSTRAGAADPWSDLSDAEVSPQPALEPLDPDGPLPLRPWTRKQAARIYPQIVGHGRVWMFDELLGARRRPAARAFQKHREHPAGGFEVEFNSRGHKDRELLERADWRVVLTGDSQTEGVCSIEESFAQRLEARLRGSFQARAIEVVNAGVGGSNPWTYLGVLESTDDLQVDAFLPVFYGGNDFSGAVGLERVLRQRGAPNAEYRREWRELQPRLPEGLGPVELVQALYFDSNPQDEAFAVAAWVSLAVEMDRRCRARGIVFRPVYMPPPIQGMPAGYAAERAALREQAPGSLEWIAVSDRLADAWIAALEARGIETLDLRPAFAPQTRKLHWLPDRHLNLQGQEVVADALFPALLELGRSALAAEEQAQLARLRE